MTNTLKECIVDALKEYDGWVQADGEEALDFTNTDYKELERDVQEEIDDGDDRPIVDIIDDLFGKLGSKHYGIK